MFLRAIAVIIALVSCLGSASRAAAPSDSATAMRCATFAKSGVPAPAPQTDPEAVARFDEITREVRTGSHNVLFLGDSITQKWDRSTWDEHFAPLNSLNAGVSGDRTEHLLWRIDHGNLERQNPHLVVLLIGTNDIGRDRLANVIAQGVRDILSDLRSRLPRARILLLGVLPRGESPAFHRRQQVKEVNALIRTCADDRHIFYADVADSLLDRTGRLPPTVSTDGVHLTAQGYARLADRLKHEFDRVPPRQ